MHSLFDADSPLMNGLQKIFDCMLLSLCWVTACLPIVTIGTACGALYRTIYRTIRRDEGYVMKTFWTTFRKNLKCGILVWLPIVAVYAFLIADAAILRAIPSMARLYGIVLLLLGVASVWAAYCTAYCVRFNGSIREILWINLFLVLSHPAMTLVILLFLLAGFALGLLVPYLVLFLPALICLAISFPMETVFKKHMHPEDVEKLEQGV